MSKKKDKKKKEDKKEESQPIYLLFFLLLFGYCLYYVGLATYENFQLFDKGVKAKARVVDIAEVRKQRTVDYYPVVQFNGLKIQGSRTCFYSTYRRGQEVEVLYLESSPHTFIINDTSYRWGYLWNNFRPWVILLGFISLLFLWGPGQQDSKYAKAIKRTR